MKVTRIARSKNLNEGKYSALVEQARRLGTIRSEVWQRYGSIGGLNRSDRNIRDEWLAQGRTFAVSANAWKETLRDAKADILNTTVEPTGTLRVILRDGRVEIHYAVEVEETHDRGSATLGVDKGYTEVLVDSDGDYHGEGLGEVLKSESDARKAKNQRRAKLRAIAKNTKNERNWKRYLSVEVLRSYSSILPIPRKWIIATVAFSASAPEIRFTVSTGWYCRRTRTPRSTCWQDCSIPRLIAGLRTARSSPSCWRGPSAYGWDCSTRTPVAGRPAYQRRAKCLKT